MKFYELTETQAENYTCCFEEWDKERKQMSTCGAPAVYSLGARVRNPLCKDHGKQALAMEKVH